MLRSLRIFGLMSAIAVVASPMAVAQTGPQVKQGPAAVTGPQAEAKKSKQAQTKPKQDGAESLRLIDAGQASLQAGRHEQAIQQLTAALQGGSLATSDMARALYMRGAAQRSLGKPALAIADLTSALWLKNGLKDADRQDALQQRSAAYREAGLSDQATPGATQRSQTAAAGSAGGGWGTSSVSAARADPATTTGSLPSGAPAASAAPGLGGFFSNLFGGASTAASSPAVAASAPPAVPAPPQTALSGWSTVTSSGAAAASPPKPERSARTATSPVQTASVRPTPPAGDATASGRFQLQIASATSRAEAEQVASRMRQQNPDDLKGRRIEISEGAFGGRAYFRVRVGPFAAASEPVELCQKLRGQGFDCLPLSQ